MLVMGLDLGTTKSAAVLYDTKKQRLLDVHSQTHHADLLAEENAAEQDANKLLEVVFESIRFLSAELRRKVKAIGVTGQMHSVLGWNREQVFPLVTWQDRRCGKQGLLPEFSTRSGHMLYDGFGAATLARLGKETASWEYASTIMDYLVCRLANLEAPVTDPADAASWGIFDLSAGGWDFLAADALEIPRRLLPEIRPGGSVAGKLSKKYAERLGLEEGIPVHVPTGDNQASILGTGRCWENELYLTLGTGAQLSAVITPEEAACFRPEGRVELRPFFGNRMLAVAACLCGGRAFSWLGETVRNWLETLQIPCPELPELLDRIDQEGMSALKDGIFRPIICPSFLGERGAETLRGEIRDITLDNFSLGALTAATAEGIIRNLKQDFPPEILSTRKELLGSGNGIRKVHCIQEIIRREFPQKLILTDSREEAACGAAKLASGV